MTMFVNSSPRRTENDLSNVFVQSGFGRDSYLHGIGFSRVSSSRLPVNDDVVQFFTAARWKTMLSICPYNLVLVVIRSFTV